ncbi:hypothetical protein [Halolamina salifodinae]|uniref:Putative membrane protein YphA (DoxX/SURF4 family) n=1 Tax=Halolamina salifodinae TaxID=1202767 RepID=A0A8T4H0D3_9EURY|nr:hypothetical protein [Halolamina salifodinae]MBP1987244.1 putative membrane protein YphA (DoxX/SURF4 family) [Halolamina salifodinae]
MRPAQRGGSYLTAFVIVVFLVFMLVLFVVAGIPTIDGTSDAVQQADDGAIEKMGYSGNMSFVLDVSLVIAPAMLMIGIVVYLYAVVAGKGSFRGGGPR